MTPHRRRAVWAAIAVATVTLRPGRYELLCKVPGHYAAGMHAELDVAR